MSEVTRILSAIEQGDPRAAEQLLPLVYEELRQLAAQKLAQEVPGQTLQATGLVHEAYLRLVDVDNAQRWNSRGHFFAAAAEAMRRILVDNARRKRSLKRGGDLVRQDLDALEIATPEGPEDLVALDEALDKLAATDKTAAELVHLRFFAGLPVPEAAGDFLGKPAPERLAEALADSEKLGETQAETPAEGKESEALGFLAPATKPGVLGRLGHYEVLDVIGRGGMGIVLRAFDETLHRVVAIKVMAAQLASNANARQRFLREARAAAAVSHDHVVTIHAVEEANGLPYIVMQYVSG